MSATWWIIVAGLACLVVGCTVGVVLAAMLRSAALEDEYRRGWNAARQSRRRDGTRA